MPSIPTTGTSGNSYATIAEADAFLDNLIDAGPLWLSVDPDSKARALLHATILLDNQCWIGTKTADSNTLEWPRTGVTDADGNAIDENTVPDQIVNGTIRLAYELSQDPTLASQQNTGSNDKKYVAGSVSIEFFRPGGVLGTNGITRFPFAVMEFIREFLCGYSGKGAPSSFGTDHTSQFDDCDTYGLDQPLS